MKRTIKFSGYGHEPTLALNVWLNKRPASKLINIHVLNHGGAAYSIIAVVDVPEGTKIYKAEYEDCQQSKDGQQLNDGQQPKDDQQSDAGKTEEQEGKENDESEETPND